MLKLSVLVFLMGLTALGVAWGGYVLTFLWAWFMVPTFGLPPLTLASAIGITLVARYLARPGITQEDQSWWFQLTLSVMRPATALLIGWVVKHWM